MKKSPFEYCDETVEELAERAEQIGHAVQIDAMTVAQRE